MTKIKRNVIEISWTKVDSIGPKYFGTTNKMCGNIFVSVMKKHEKIYIEKLNYIFD